MQPKIAMAPAGRYKARAWFSFFFSDHRRNWTVKKESQTGNGDSAVCTSVRRFMTQTRRIFYLLGRALIPIAMGAPTLPIFNSKLRQTPTRKCISFLDFFKGAIIHSLSKERRVCFRVICVSHSLVRQSLSRSSSLPLIGRVWFPCQVHDPMHRSKVSSQSWQ